MFRLWTGRLEWASKDGKPGIFDAARHLRVGHVFIKEDTFDKCSVCQGTADFTVDLDEVERNITPIKICDRQNGIYGNFCKLVMFF
jgi:hypothetical protein